jgi:hypothetical protein
MGKVAQSPGSDSVIPGDQFQRYRRTGRVESYWTLMSKDDPATSDVSDCLGSETSIPSSREFPGFLAPS